MKKRKYPSDISREKFEEIREILESCKKRTKPRKVELLDIFNGILYLLKSGCQWRMLPSEYPKWQTCHYYFKEWRSIKDKNGDSVIDRSFKKISWKGSFKTFEERKNKFTHN